jgi:nucleotidyltransferase substrate binding protein (TIGR01987 family)
VTEKLILTSFQKALEPLEAVLRLPKDDIVRDAAIQRAKCTYELAWKMIKRHLTWVGVSNVDSLTRRSLFSEAARIGLILDAEVWLGCHEARNLTSHAYDEVRAEEVYVAARILAPGARRLFIDLSRYHAGYPC